MHFHKEKVEDFKKLFNKTYSQIRNFDGCRFLALYQDDEDSGIFFTISKWENPQKLDTYRNSDLFRETWSITKTFFSAPTEAHSLLEITKDPINPF